MLSATYSYQDTINDNKVKFKFKTINFASYIFN